MRTTGSPARLCELHEPKRAVLEARSPAALGDFCQLSRMIWIGKYPQSSESVTKREQLRCHPDRGGSIS
jgi:hypothetical protein